MDSAKQVHLEMIQSVVARLSNNSFHVKGWSVLLVSAVLTFTANKSSTALPWLGLLPAIAMWSLDAQMLSAERDFRKLYDQVRNLPETSIDFRMKVETTEKASTRWISSATSTGVALFHGPVVLVTALVALLSAPS